MTTTEMTFGMKKSSEKIGEPKFEAGQSDRKNVARIMMPIILPATRK